MNKKYFILKNNAYLSNLDYKALTLLYQPLLGSLPYALYQVFFELSKAEKNFTFSFLLDLLNIKIDTFFNSLKKLEALGLIDTYENSDHYLYIIKQPHTPKQFLSDTILGSYLQSEIGIDQTEILSKIFEKEDVDYTKYQFVTHSFDDVYSSHHLPLLKTDKIIEGHDVVTRSIRMRNNFNMSLFIEKIPDRLKSPQLFTKKYEEMLAKIQYVYQFDIDEMAELFISSYQQEIPNSKQLNMKARYILNKKPYIKEIIEDEMLLYESLTPKQIVENYVTNGAKAEALDTIYQLTSRYDIDNGVLNVLLMFILKRQEGVLPHVNYLDKVFSSWLKKGVQTINDALKIIDDFENVERKPINKYDKKPKYQPKWMDNFIDKMEKWGEDDDK